MAAKEKLQTTPRIQIGGLGTFRKLFLESNRQKGAGRLCTKGPPEFRGRRGRALSPQKPGRRRAFGFPGNLTSEKGGITLVRNCKKKRYLLGQKLFRGDCRMKKKSASHLTSPRARRCGRHSNAGASEQKNGIKVS